MDLKTRQASTQVTTKVTKPLCHQKRKTSMKIVEALNNQGLAKLKTTPGDLKGAKIVYYPELDREGQVKELVVMVYSMTADKANNLKVRCGASVWNPHGEKASCQRKGNRETALARYNRMPLYLSFDKFPFTLTPAKESAMGLEGKIQLEIALRHALFQHGVQGDRL